MNDSEIIKVLSSYYSAEELMKAMKVGDIKFKSEFKEKDDKSAEEAKEAQRHADEDNYDEGFVEGEDKEKKKEKKEEAKEKKEAIGKEEKSKCGKMEKSEAETEVKEDDKKEVKEDKSRMDKMEKSIESILDRLNSFAETFEKSKEVKPSLKSEGISGAFLEKSISTEPMQKVGDKVVLDLESNKGIIKSMLGEFIATEKDADIKKSIEEASMDYLCGGDELKVNKALADKFAEKNFVLGKK